jgi:hypothetical protein
MERISPFERDLIARALSQSGTHLAPGTSLALMPDTIDFHRIFREAVSPALHDCGFRAADSEPAFDSKSWLSDAVRRARGAEIIIADLTGRNPDIMYVLGLCHGLGRCPLIITQDMDELPFNLDGFRRIHYHPDEQRLYQLRENLSRAVRVFLAEAEASRDVGK